MTTETFVIDSRGRATMDKDPNAILDYSWDWTAWLSALNGDTISSATVSVTGGLTVGTVGHDATFVTAWLSSGTVGVRATATCRIVTVGGRTEDRTIYLYIRER